MLTQEADVEIHAYNSGVDGVRDRPSHGLDRKTSFAEYLAAWLIDAMSEDRHRDPASVGR